MPADRVRRDSNGVVLVEVAPQWPVTFVKLGHHQSPAVNLNVGVRLGPLLFAVYCSPVRDTYLSSGEPNASVTLLYAEPNKTNCRNLVLKWYRHSGPCRRTLWWKTFIWLSRTPKQLNDNRGCIFQVFKDFGNRKTKQFKANEAK